MGFGALSSAQRFFRRTSHYSTLIWSISLHSSPLLLSLLRTLLPAPGAYSGTLTPKAATKLLA